MDIIRKWLNLFSDFIFYLLVICWDNKFNHFLCDRGLPASSLHSSASSSTSSGPWHLTVAARRKDYEWDKRDRIIMETVKPRAWDRKEWLQVSSCLERSHDSNPWNPVHITHSLTVPTVGHPGSVHYKKIKYYLRLVRARRRIPQGEPSDRGVTVRSGSTSSSINKLYDLTGFISYLYDITVILLFVSYYLYFFYFCFSVSRDYWKEIKEAEIQIIRIW